MGNHDNELIFGDLFEDIHDLNTGLSIKSTCRLVGENNIRIIDKSTRDGNTLHLTAGHLGRLLFQLISETDFFQSFCCTFTAFFLADTGKRKCDLDIRENILMRDQVVGLKYKTDRMVSVCVPVSVFVVFGRSSVDDQITGGVLVETADNVQHRRLTASGLAKDRNKFTVTEAEANTF